ncbi:MAG: type III pantothenate kinase [Oscillospiraceae bacterium]|jgi:type III pantothenate kinase|nr:type III pantothenate kinase [Oscillospiraceae bacterium]
MLLAVDAGNTNLTLGVYQEGALCFQGRLCTDRRLTADQLAIQFTELFRLNNADPARCRDAVIASVVSELTGVLARAAQKLTGQEPLVLAPGIKTGLNIKIDNPAQLGADIIATAVAAKALYPLPCLVVDLGTATKISALAADGSFLGGIISAGLAISLEALAACTSMLPRVAFQAPPRAIGTNTVDSMQSGSVFGTAAMIDGMLARMERELGTPATVVATGGFSGDIIAHCARKIVHDDTLALRGLHEIYRKNRP